jgi:molybdopterin-containing oxidoreductase family iron-sulfur binding subunit
MTAAQTPSEIVERRGFVAAAVVAAGAALGVAVSRSLGDRATPGARQGTADPLETMRADLQRALSKPSADRGWGMVIDMRKCIGCRACVVACVAENALPPGVAYRKVREVEFGGYPEVRRLFMPSNCQHCDEPPCREAAPEGAITKRDDGIVEFHYERLRDPAVARAVAEACPYGAVEIDGGGNWTDQTPSAEPYERIESPDYGRAWNRAAGGLPIGAPRKCHFCLHKVERGELPACVTTCVGRAMYFGDFNDPLSTVSRLRSTVSGLRHKEQLHTEPRIVYLTDEPDTCRACHG